MPRTLAVGGPRERRGADSPLPDEMHERTRGGINRAAELGQPVSAICFISAPAFVSLKSGHSPLARHAGRTQLNVAYNAQVNR